MSDLIERKKAIDIVNAYKRQIDPYPRVVESLEKLPSAQPEPCNLPQLGATYEDGDKLDEAIREYESKADICNEDAEEWKKVNASYISDIQLCEWSIEESLKKESKYRQLAQWLRELKEWRQQGGI